MTASDLIEQLQTLEWKEAKEELLRIGAPVAPALMFASYCFDISGETEARDAALSLLERIARPGTERFVAAMAGEHLWANYEMSDALRILVWTSETEADAVLVDTIAGFLQRGGKGGEEAAKVLGESGSPLAVPRLLEALAEYPPQQWPAMGAADLRLCRQTARALGCFDDPCAAVPLAEFLYHPDVSLSRYAASALAGIGEPAREMIKAIASGLVVPVRNAPKPLRELQLLRVLGDAECVTPIAIRACDPDPEVRAYALAALGSLPLTQEQLVAVAELLLQGIKDPEPDVRRSAIEYLTEAHIAAAVAHMSSLREVSDDEARRILLTPLVQALDDGNESVRSSALAALQRQAQTGDEDLMALTSPEDLDSGIKEESTPAEAADAAVPGPALEGPHDANETLVSLWTDLEGNWDTAIAMAMTAEAIRAALVGGANLNAGDKDGTTALMASAWAGHMETVRLLLTTEADVNAADASGRTALMEATYGGEAEITRLLLEAGADWTIADSDGKTAVHEAENPDESVPEENKAATVAVLWAAINAELVSLWTGPDGKLDSEKALTMTVGAVKAALKAGAAVEAQDKDGSTALTVAARAGRSDVLSILLDAGADPNVIENGYTALKYAATQGNIEIISLLLEAGADPDAGRFGWTALSWAAINNEVEATRLLLGAGADPDAPKESGEPLLLDIARYASPEVFDLLLKAGADQEAVDDDGRTVLMLAATNGNAAGVQRLVEAGVNVVSMDVNGHNALWHAENPEQHVSGESTALIVEALRAALNAAFLALWTGGSNSPDRKFPSRRIIEAVLAGGAEVNGVDGDGWTALLRACDYSHTLGVGLLLENGANAQATTPTGFSGIMLAARNGNVEAVRLLLKAGAEVNRVDNYGRTALRFAATSGYARVVRLLVKYQADVNIIADDESEDDEYDDRITPLNLACEGGHTETVSVLLDNHAEVNAPGYYGCNSLIYACRGKHTDIVELLLNAGADVQAADFESGETPLEIAASNNNVEIARLLLEADADVNDADPPVLNVAAEHGYAELVSLFLKAGARLEKIDFHDQRRTALIEACDNGHLEIARRLLKAGANVDATDHNGYTALMTAAWGGSVDIVETLLKAGASVDLGDYEGCTALMLAGGPSQATIVDFLLKAGADCNTTNRNGETALMRKCRSGNARSAHLLLAAHADVEAADEEGKTALIFAAEGGDTETIYLMLKARGVVDPCSRGAWQPLITAAEGGHLEAMRMLVREGEDVNAADNHGRTALMLAAAKGHLEVVRLLLHKGADIDTSDHQGVTALMMTCENGFPEVVNFLLAQGADKNIMDKDGRNACQYVENAYHAWVDDEGGWGMERERKAENEAKNSRLDAVRLLLEPEISDTNVADGNL